MSRFWMLLTIGRLEFGRAGCFTFGMTNFSPSLSSPFVHIPGATGDRAEVIKRYPRARAIRVGHGTQYPIYAIFAGKIELGKAEGISAAWKKAARG